MQDHFLNTPLQEIWHKEIVEYSSQGILDSIQLKEVHKELVLVAHYKSYAPKLVKGYKKLDDIKPYLNRKESRPLVDYIDKSVKELIDLCVAEWEWYYDRYSFWS